MGKGKAMGKVKGELGPTAVRKGDPKAVTTETKLIRAPNVAKGASNAEEEGEDEVEVVVTADKLLFSKKTIFFSDLIGISHI